MPGLGWVCDLPDMRDHVYAAPQAVLDALPAKAMLLPTYADERHTGFLGPAFDQSNLGACVGNSTAALLQFVRAKEGKADAARVPSRLMIYYLAREIEQTVSLDAGAQIRDAMKALATTGACFEDGGTPDSWPYDISKFAVKPPPECYAAASKDLALTYSRVDRNIDAMKACLAEGYPFVFGFSVYTSFMTMTNGRVTMPLRSENLDGGHAVLAMGYDDAGKVILVRNSWGAGWGPFRGHFLMPYDYFLDENLSSDFWTMRLSS